jgi:hypothetical protein
VLLMTRKFPCKESPATPHLRTIFQKVVSSSCKSLDPRQSTSTAATLTLPGKVLLFQASATNCAVARDSPLRETTMIRMASLAPVRRAPAIAPAAIVAVVFVDVAGSNNDNDDNDGSDSSDGDAGDDGDADGDSVDKDDASSGRPAACDGTMPGASKILVYWDPTPVLALLLPDTVAHVAAPTVHLPPTEHAPSVRKEGSPRGP